MRRRRGITLIEVLVAIFIMSIGLLALLTLFPLGALRMASALQDDRTGSAASAGANLCDAFGVRQDPTFYTKGGVNLFLAPPGFPPAAINGGGYPLYVDPWGVGVNGPNSPVGTLNVVTAAPGLNPGIPRVTSSVYPGMPGTASAARYYTLMDDMTFLNNGLPDTGTPPGSTPIQRGGRYTWAYLLHRLPPGGDSNALVDLTIVVYAGRALTQVPPPENTFAATGLTNDTSVTVTHPPGVPPNIRRGTWILDTSFNPTTSSVNGDFYRVVAVTTMDNSHVNLELQTPLAKSLTQPPAVPVGMTSLTVLDNVADVFNRGVSDSNKWEFHAQP